MKADASVLAGAGTVRATVHGDVTVHTWIGPEDGLLVNTQIVEGPTSLIIFDGQYFLSHGTEVAAYAKALRKPVERVILSHIHLDHWGGLSAIIEQFPAASVYAVARPTRLSRRSPISRRCCAASALPRSQAGARDDKGPVIASEAKQSRLRRRSGLLVAIAPRKKGRR